MSTVTPPPFTTVHPLSATIPHPVFRPWSKHTLFKPQIRSPPSFNKQPKGNKKGVQTDTFCHFAIFQTKPITYLFLSRLRRNRLLIIFICTSKFFRLFVAIVSKIRPHPKESKDATIRKPLPIKVGKRGTNPV